MKIIITTLLYFFSITLLYSQNTDWNIMTRVPATNNAIKLRWMPATASDWQKGVTNGYTITKKRYSAAGVFEANETNIVIDPVLEGDSTLAKWTAFWKPDSTIHKTLFYLSVNKNISLNTVQDAPTNSPSSTSLDERYFFANVMADLKFKAAELCGLGYTDQSVVAGKKYEYVITTNGTAQVSASTGQIAVSSSTLPTVPISFTSEFRRLKVNWNTTTLLDHYPAYHVEKSTNAGASYTRLTVEPLVNFADSTKWMHYADSIPNVTATYRYRIVGISYFDEMVYFPHKDTTVTKVIEHAPGVRAVLVSGANYKVNWRYPHDQAAYSVTQANADLTTYSLAVSKKPEALNGQPEFKVVKTGIAKGDTTTTVTRESVTKALGDTNSVFFFHIVANATGVASVQSNPYGYIPQIKDNTPPSVPTNAIIGTPVDVSGDRSMFRVSWSRSTDNTGGVGMLGYRVFRTLGSDSEKIEVSGGIKDIKLATDTTKAYIQDTLSKNLDYTLVKYHISAFDKNYNESAQQTVSYTQPDTKRPMPPKIISFVLDSTNKVTLNFNLSPSKRNENIIHHILRKELENSSWTTISTISNTQNISSFIDATTLGGKEYYYSIRAVDAANNYSCDSIPTLSHTITALPGYCYQIVSVKTLNLTTKAALTTLTQTYDENSKSVTLAWTYAQTLVKGYEIYRGITASPTKFAYLDFVEEPLKKYIDYNVEFNTAYSYRVRAVFTDGSVSSWKDVQVTSLKKSILASNKEFITFANATATEVATITSNVNWTVTKSDTWITTSATTGVNNGSVTIGATANTGTETRQGTVTISSGTTLSTVITVVQHPLPSGTGITVKYYNFPDLASIQSRPPNVSKLETQINLSASSSPTSGVLADFTSVWEGYIEVPKSGLYTFYLQADEGANFYLNDKKLISSTGNIEKSTTAQELIFGQKYTIKIEHWDSADYAVLNLKWSSNVGLSKSLITTPYLYPLFVPTGNQQDPLDGNCFVIRNPSNNYTIQTPGNFTIIQAPFSNKNNQKWQFIKDGNHYKIISQIDNLKKTIQVFNNGSALYDKTMLGFNSDKSSEKWGIISQGNNLYKINRSGTSYNWGIENWNGNLTPALFSGGDNFILESTTCPNFNGGITLDTDQLDVDFKQQTKSIVLKSDAVWDTINYLDWLNISPEGSNQNETVNILIARNTSNSSRSGTINFKNSNGTSSLTINQGPRPCLELGNVIVECSTKGPTGVKVYKSDGTIDTSSVLEFSIDNQGIWKDYIWQHQFLSNGPHILHARLKSNPNCTGSINFSIYCN